MVRRVSRIVRVRTRTRAIAGGVVNTLFRIIVVTLQKPVLLISIALGYYYFNHETELTALITKLSKLPIVGAIFTELISKPKIVAGTIPCIGGALSSRRYSLGVAALVFFAVALVLPAQSKYKDYALLGVAISAVLSARTTQQQLFLGILGAALVTYEVWGLKLE